VGSGVAVDRIDPDDPFGAFDRFDVEVDDDRLVVTANQHAFERLVGRRVDLLVRQKGRDKGASGALNALAKVRQ
jgi:hypothetical protein